MGLASPLLGKSLGLASPFLAVIAVSELGGARLGKLSRGWYIPARLKNSGRRASVGSTRASTRANPGSNLGWRFFCTIGWRDGERV